MSVSTILTSKRGFVRSPAFLAASLALAAALPMSAMAEIQKTNPVTGETENYTWKFVGTDTWNGTGYWQNSDGNNPTGVPGKSGEGNFEPFFFDGSTVSINAGMSVEGWDLRMGLFNGATLTMNNLQKFQDGTMWVTVDESSKLTITANKNDKYEGDALNLYSAREAGIEWTCALSNAGGTGLPFNYYLAGHGTVAFTTITAANCSHTIKRADVTLSEVASSKTVRSKTLVSFTSSTSTFLADATIKVKNADGTANRDVALSSVTPTTSTLTESGNVGDCELVQTSTGILLYYVDYAKAYKNSININFTSGTALSTSDDVGLTGYAIPGTSWNNLAVANNASLSALNAADSSGSTFATAASVTITGTRGSHSCSALTAASDLRHGYIDENDGNPTPTVTVSGIPYEKYRVVVYVATDTPTTGFGYITINGKNYTYSNGNVLVGTDAWGASGAQNSAEPIAEGVNVMVSPVTLGSTLTVVGHRGTNARGCIAAVQIVEYVPEVTENDLVIPVMSASATYTVGEAKTLSGTVYVVGNGTLTLDGSAKITASTIDVAKDVVLNINADRLDATTFTGAGTVVYDGVQPDENIGFDDAAWSGTVWVMNVGNGGTTSKVDAPLGTGSGASGTAAANNGLNKWGNANSSVKFTNVRGYVSNAACPWTLILEDDGDNYAWYNNNGWAACEVSFAALRGTGTFCDKSVDANPCRQKVTILDPSGFAGAMDVEGKRVGLGGSSTLASEAASNGSIEIVAAGATLKGGVLTSKYGVVVNGPLTVDGDISVNKMAVASTGTLTINAGKTLTQTARPLTIDGTAAIDGRLYCDDPDLSAAINGTVTVAGAFDSQGDVVIGSSGSVTVSGKLWANYGVAVNGDLSAPSLANLLSVSYFGEPEVTVNQGGVFTLTSTANVNDTGNGNVDYSRVKGTGTLKFYSTAGHRTFPNDATKMPATTLTIQTEVADSLIITKNDGETVMGSLSGSGNIRSDWGDNGVNGRTLTVTQTKDTEWQGKFVSNRLTAFNVTGTGGVLTLSGAFDSATAVPMTIELAGNVKLTGTYIGDTTVAGMFGGTGTLNGNLTFSSGATFKAYGTSGLTLSSGRSVVLPASGSVAVDVSVISNDITSAGVTLISSGVPEEISAFTVDSAFYLVSDLGGLKIYPVSDSPVAEYGGTQYYKFADAIDAAIAAGGDIADITVLIATAPLPAGYKFVTVGETTKIAKYPVVLVKAAAVYGYYNTVFDAIIAAQGVFDYVEIVAGDSFDLPMGMMATIKVKNTANATGNVDDVADDCSIAITEDEPYTVYSKVNKPTEYTWTGNATEHRWGNRSNWSFVNDSSETATASRAPEDGDSVAFTSSVQDLTIGADTSVATVSIGAAITVSKEYTPEVTLTATSGGIVLTDVGAAITASGVTLSPAPTTTIADSYVKVEEVEDGTRYSVAGIPVLALDGTAATWSTGAWKVGAEGAAAAPLSGPAKIVVSESTTLTVDVAVDLSELVVTGAVDKVLTLVTGSGSLVAQAVIVEGGVLQQGSAAVLGATPSIVVKDGATFDLNGLAVNEANVFTLAGAGAGEWPWALTSSGDAFPIGTLRAISLSGNAAIGGANRIRFGKSGVVSTITYNGYTLTKTGTGELVVYNGRSVSGGTGTFDITGGEVSFHEGICLDGYEDIYAHTEVVLRDGAILRNNANSFVWMDTLNWLGGTVNSTKNPFAIATAFEGSGTTAKLRFASGSQATLTGDLEITGSLEIGAYGYDSGNVAFVKAAEINPVTVTVSGTFASSSGMVLVGDGVTLNLGLNRPAATIIVQEGGTLAAQMQDTGDIIRLTTMVQPGSVILYDSDGNLVSNPRVTFDSGTLTIAPTVPTLEASGTVVFDTAANWVDSMMPSVNGDAIIALSGDASISVSGTYTLGMLTVTGSGVVTFSGDGTINANNINVRKGATLVRNLNVSATAGIDLASGTVLRINGVTESAVISGAGAVETYGDVTMGGANTFTGGITAKTGTLSTSVYNGFAGKQDDGTYRVTVEDGACLDIANTKDTTHTLTIAGKGVLLSGGTYSGAVKNSGNVAFGLGNRQARSITLSADAMVDVSTGWGIVRNGYNDAALVLNGHTLTMRGTGTVPMSTVNASSPSGTLVLDGATLYLGKNASNLAGVNIIARGCATINIEVAPSALGSLTIAPTASGTTASNWNLPSTPLPTVDTSNIDTTGLTNGEVLTIFTAPNTTVLSNETISVQTSARFTSELDGNLVKVAYIAGMPANFMHYDFDEGASSASDSGTAFDVGGENTDVTLVSSKNGKAIQVHTNFTPWWHTLANGTSPFHVGEVTVTTVAKLCETNIVLWGLGGSANANAMGLVATDANTVAVVVKNGSAIVETLATVTGANDLTKGWHFFAVVSDENGTTLYVDDLFVATAKSLPAGIGQQGQLGSFHGTPDGTGYNKVGASGYYLDDWRVYDAALTTKEVKALKREICPNPLFIRLR